MTTIEMTRPADAVAASGLRRVLLLGCPRSRTSVVQTVVSQACDLATMPSTNWWLESRITELLNGPEGWTRQRFRTHSRSKIEQYLEQVTGVVLPAAFDVVEALDLLATETGAVGWLEKTPMHVMAIEEIESQLPDAKFVHLVRDPAAVVESFLRRSRRNPEMFGAGWQAHQPHDEEIWRECTRVTLSQLGRPDHLAVYSEAFVADPEAEARRIAGFLQLDYRSPTEPGRVAAVAAAQPSDKPWQREAVGPVRRIAHDDDVVLTPLETETVELWHEARERLGIVEVSS